MGWLTVYIPNTDIFLAHGSYEKEKSNSKPSWNTPEAARSLLRSIVDFNGKEMLMRCSTKSEKGKKLGENLLDVALHAENAPEDSSDVPVDAAITFRQELDLVDKDEVPGAMICIDDFNALFGNSKFSESVSLKRKRKIKTSELRLAAAWRDLSGDSPIAPESKNDTSRLLMVVANSQQYDYLLPFLGSKMPMDFDKLPLVDSKMSLIYRIEEKPQRCIACLKPFDSKEVQAYLDRIQVYNIKVDDIQAGKIAAISGGNGLLLRTAGLFY